MPDTNQFGAGEALPAGTTVGGAAVDGASPSAPASVGSPSPRYGQQQGEPLPEGTVVGAVDRPKQDDAPQQPTLLSRTGEVSSVSGMFELGKQVANYTFVRPLDLYHQMVDAQKRGDTKTASEAANKLISYARPDLGLLSSDHPLYKAAEAILMQPIDEIKAMYAENQKAGHGAAASVLPVTGSARHIKEGGSKALDDVNRGDYAAAAGHAVGGLLNTHEVGAFPVVGPALKDFGDKVETDLVAHNYGAATGDALGAAIAIFGPKVVSKAANAAKIGAEAAETVNTAGKIGANAPEEASLANKVGTHVADVQDSINTAHASATTQATAARDAAVGSADTAFDSADTAANAERDAAKQSAIESSDMQSAQGHEDVRSIQNNADAQLADATSTADTEHAANTQAAHEDLTGQLSETAGDAPDHTELAKIIDNAITEAEKSAHTDFENGINGEGGIVDRLDGHELDAAESPLSEMAGQLLEKPVPEDHPHLAEMKAASGDNLAPKVRRVLENLRDAVNDTVDSDGKPAKEQTPPYTGEQLVKIRQTVRKWAGEFIRGDINARVLRRLLPAIDDTIETMARKAGETEAVDPARLDQSLKSEPGYAYHATNEENLRDIADSGSLDTHAPSYGTEQDVWPDGATEPRSYFTKQAGTAWQFAPEEGKPVVIRTASGSLRTETTGDLFSNKPIASRNLEYLGSDGKWHPVDSITGAQSGRSVVQDYADLRAKYRASREVLDSNTADKLSLDEPDKAMSNINDYLLSGKNAPAKLNTLRRIVGNETMNTVARAKVADWVKAAEIDPKLFLKQWDKMTPEVRQAFFGKEMADKLGASADFFRKVSEAADNVHAATTDAAVTEHATAIDTAKNTNKAFDKAIKLNRANAFTEADAKYTQAMETAKELRQQARDAAKAKLNTDVTAIDAYKQTATENAGLDNPFVRSLADGKVNAKLLAGKVDVVDIADLKKALGPERFGDIADGIFQRWIKESTNTNGHFDPQALVDKWAAVKPEIRTTLFADTASQPARLAQVQKMIDDVETAAKVKRVNKVAARVAVLSGATALGGVAGSHVLGGVGELFGMASGMTGGFAASGLVEFLANHPLAWKSLTKISNAAEVARKAAPVIDVAAPRATTPATKNDVFGSADSLAGNN